MAYQPTNRIQRRIINNFVRRNIQGWGRPLSFTLQFIRLGILFGIVTVVLLLIDVAVNGPTAASQLRSGTSLFLGILALLAGFLFVGSMVRNIPPYIRAIRQPTEHISGKVEVAICDLTNISPMAGNSYHFITLRQENGRLRAFAIDPAIHDQACVKDKYVTLTVIPGIERVTKVE